MFLPDVNVLLYAIDSTSPQHDRCRDWLTAALNGNEAIGWAWNVLLGFVRIGTNPRALTNPLTVSEALDYVEQWLDQPPSQFIEPTPRHLTELGKLLRPSGSGGNRVSDAHLAALAIEHDGKVCSCDTDFAHFPGLTWFNPLTDS